MPKPAQRVRRAALVSAATCGLVLAGGTAALAAPSPAGSPSPAVTPAVAPASASSTHYVYFVSYDDNGNSTINRTATATGTTTVLATAPDEHYLGEPRLTPDGTRLAWTEIDYTTDDACTSVRIADPDGSNVSPARLGGSSGLCVDSLAWAPDDTTLWVTVYNANTGDELLYTYDTGTGATTSKGVIAYHVDVSDSGQVVIADDNGIELYDPSTSDTSTLVADDFDNDYYYYWPRFSSAGVAALQEHYDTTTNLNTYTVVVVPLGGGEPDVLTSSAGPDTYGPLGVDDSAGVVFSNDFDPDCESDALQTTVIATDQSSFDACGTSPRYDATAADVPSSESQFVPLPATRIYAGQVGTSYAPVQVTGKNGVPDKSSVTAVAVNVEVQNPTGSGYVRVTPYGADAQVATQEYVADPRSTTEALSNLAVVKVLQGKIQVKLSTGSAKVFMDVAGYYTDEPTEDSAVFGPVPTTRIYNATVGTSYSQVQVAGVGPVPADATAVAVNVEVQNPTASGYVRVTPSGADAQVATQEFVADPRSTTEAISNLVIAKLVNGKIQVKLSTGSARVFMDVAGFYRPFTDIDDKATSNYVALPTARLFASTVGTSYSTIQVTGHAGVPAGATAVAVNVEVQNPSTSGYVRVTPGGADAQVATQEYVADPSSTTEAVSNLVICKLDSQGRIQVKLSSGTGKIFADVAGYYTG